MRRALVALGLLTLSCNTASGGASSASSVNGTNGASGAPNTTGAPASPARALVKPSSGGGAVVPSPAATFPCYANRPKEGRAFPPIAAFAKPQKGVVQEEPTFHTCLVRAADHTKEGFPGFSRNDYSRRQAFNADASRYITTVGDGHWLIYDASTFAPVVAPKLAGDAEPQWHPTDPNILFFGETNGGLVISSLDIRTNTTSVAIDLHGKLPWPNAARCWMKSEGSPSQDARYWAFQCETDAFQILGFAVWDRTANKLLGSIPMTSRPDHVSMSPSGKWMVSSGDETIAWSPDFKTKKVLRKGSEHSDLAIGKNGHDYYVSIDYQAQNGDVFMTDLDTGVRTDLMPTYANGGASAFHFSGKAFGKPGWVLVSTYGGYGAKLWYMEKVMVMELAPNPRIYQLASHHSILDQSPDAYFAEPQATVNRNFTRIQFNTNSGDKVVKNVDAFQIHLPPDAFP